MERYQRREAAAAGANEEEIAVAATDEVVVAGGANDNEQSVNQSEKITTSESNNEKEEKDDDMNPLVLATENANNSMNELCNRLEQFLGKQDDTRAIQKFVDSGGIFSMIDLLVD